MKLNREKPRLVVAWQHHALGGAQIYLMGIAKHLKSILEIQFLIPKDTPETTTSYLEEARLEYLPLQMGGELSSAFGFIGKLRRRLRKLLSEAQFVFQTIRQSRRSDILHVELVPWQSFSALFLIALLRRTFCTVHNRVSRPSVWRGFLWKIEMSLFAYLTDLRIFATNADAKRFLEEYTPGFVRSRIVVIPTTADVDLIEPVFAGRHEHRKDVRGRLGISEDARIVLTVGQFIDRKGRRELLEVVPSVCSANPNVQFLWLSDSEIEIEYQQHILDLSKEDRFRLISPSVIGRSRKDVFRILAAADIFVLPSHVEGLPIALLEAMAMGLPCISTDVNGIPEAIKDGETGFLVPKANHYLLAARIIELLSSPTIALKLGENGRDMVWRDFNEKGWAEVAGENYLETFESNRRGQA